MEILEKIMNILSTSGFSDFTIGNFIMIVVSGILLYLAIAKKYEPLLLVPIAFGALIANIPLTGISEPGGLLFYLSLGVKYEIYPLLIFMGVGAMTDFGPLLANPITFLIGAAAQLGIFFSMVLGLVLGFNLPEAGSIGVIGGADGPIAIYIASKMAPRILGAIAVVSYSYMSLVPVIQPPILKLLTTKAERRIEMKQLRPVSRIERILFPIISTIFVGLVLPPSVPIIGMLMVGNLFRESLVVPRLSDTAQNSLINILTIFLGICVGSTMEARYFLNFQTIEIILLGLVAFTVSTAGGVLFTKLLNKITGANLNPLIGGAGLSAVPMAARVAQVVAQKEKPGNFILMHAMGPNVAGVIGTTVAASVIIALLQ
ncbi:MAG TPA: glutaconyl-CoA decarboxylase subunit beta [Candidatus Atribacteria bacterium]|nr:glutaconyl-CoA decarboxylase subunit beta [Candidatus Atribacteria bacterium]